MLMARQNDDDDDTGCPKKFDINSHQFLLKEPQIFTECIETDQDFIFNGKRQYVLISLRICHRDGLDVV